MKPQTILFYALLGLTSLFMAFTGSFKVLLGLGIVAPPAEGALKLADGFILFIGLCEFLGGIGLWLKSYRTSVAIGLFTIMIGAIGVHVGMLQTVETLPAAVAAIFLLAIIAFNPNNRLVIDRSA